MNERQRILHRIDRLENQRCKKCDSHNYNVADIHCKCHAATEIRKLGEQLIGLTAKKKQATTIAAILQKIRDNGITLESYKTLREYDMTNQQIMKATGIPEYRFHKWKRQALKGEPAKPPKVSRQHTKDYQERQYWKEVAEKNGIKEKTYRLRISRGSTYEDAATKPLFMPITKTEEADIAEANGIKREAYRDRIAKGWPPEYASRVPMRRRLEVWLKEQGIENTNSEGQNNEQQTAGSR